MDSNEELEINRCKYLIENLRDVVWELNIEGVLVFVTRNVIEMTGYTAEEMVGHRIDDFLAEESRNYIRDLITQYKQMVKENNNRKILHDVQFICKDGSVKWLEVSPGLMFQNGNPSGLVGVSHDISSRKVYEGQLNNCIEELKRANVELNQSVAVDFLTGAFTRRKFVDDLNFLIDNRGKLDIKFSLIIFDIDYFKTINDYFGHTTGDLVLQRISEMVVKNIRKTDCLYRWGGEEFIIILSGADLECAKIVARKIKDIIQKGNFGVDREITISMGVGEYLPGESADQIFARVDKALYEAKRHGRNKIGS